MEVQYTYIIYPMLGEIYSKLIKKPNADKKKFGIIIKLVHKLIPEVILLQHFENNKD